jgi:ABC-type polar amino acid transport system ATPase subunit
VIRVRGLGKAYAHGRVLDGVDFDVQSGQLAAVIGPSGAGKSTLLRCLTGLERFDRGSIAVDEIEVHAGRTAAAQLRGRVGLVFQAFELFPHLTVLGNCVLAPEKVKGSAPEAAAALARRLLAELGLGDKAEAWPEHLSGGQKQRVAIARALAMEPRVLLYDEPTSALDPSLRREVRETLQRVKRSGVTQLVVTHDVQLARECAEELIVLDGGRVAEHGPAAEVLARPQAEATRRLLADAG